MPLFLNGKKKSGFTLIELMVVIAIVGILATIAVVNTGKNPDRDVRLEADRLTSFLRDVQSKALASEKPSKTKLPDCYDTSDNWICGKICGFGIHKNPEDSELWIYFVNTVDISGTSALDTNCSSEANAYPGGVGDPNKLETFSFRNGVAIGSFDDLFFLSPHGEVYTKGSNDSTKFPAKITLTKDSVSVDVQVDKSGRIY